LKCGILVINLDDGKCPKRKSLYGAPSSGTFGSRCLCVFSLVPLAQPVSFYPEAINDTNSDFDIFTGNL